MIQEPEKKAKHNYFMGTIAICVVYMILALLMIIIGKFTDFGKSLLFGSMISFTTTFIIGTIFVVIIATIMVIEYKPPDNKVSMPNIYKSDSCPDYWEYVSIKEEQNDDYGQDVKFDVNGNTSNLYDIPEVSKMQSNHRSYKCVPSDNIYTNRTTQKLNSDIPGFDNEDDTNKFRGYLAYMTEAESNADVNNSNVCAHVFPEYLSYLDNQKFIDNNRHGDTNHYRCKYAKLCDIPWTDAGCD